MKILIKLLNVFIILANNFVLSQKEVNLILPHPTYMKPNSFFIGENNCISYRTTGEGLVYSIFSKDEQKLLKSAEIKSTNESEYQHDLALKGGELNDPYLLELFPEIRKNKSTTLSEKGFVINDRDIQMDYLYSTEQFKVFRSTLSDTITFKSSDLSKQLKGNKSVEISISPDKTYLAYCNSRNIYIYSTADGKLIWKSEKIRLRETDSPNFELLDNHILLLPKFSKKERYTHLYWYDFTNKEITSSSKELLTNSIILSQQEYDQLLVGYGDAEKRANLTFNDYNIQQIDLRNGAISSHGKVSSGGRKLLKRSYQLKDSLSHTIEEQEFKDYYENETAFISVYRYLDNYYNYDKNNLTKESLSIRYATPVTSDLLFFDDIQLFNNYHNYQIVSAFKNKVTYIDESNDVPFFGVSYLKKELLFWNKNFELEQERKTKLIFLNHSIPFFLTGDNYYYSSKHIKDFLSFEVDFKWYSFEQFDLIFNRPDIVLERLGYSSDNIIKAFRSAYHKRLQKMNFTEDMLKPDFHIPDLAITNMEEISLNTSEPLVTLEINMKDEIYLLDRINVWINDVPIYGTNGIDLRKENSQLIKKEIQVELASGANKVQVSVLNQAGAESYKETIFINYTNILASKPSLYLISIGVSDYENNQYNLKYAGKDASDIKELFQKNSNATFEKIHVKTLLNEEVTRQNIMGLKSFLQNAQRDDIVIISFAGHGILDTSYNYYLATNDLDFNNPSIKGLPYEELESLLDGVVPLKKILLIDACHSGEIDKELVVEATKKNVSMKKVGRGAEAEYVLNEEQVISSDLYKELFNDLRRGTGATVISASGGLDVAYESSEYQNGLFTYCLLHGLQSMKADLNKDGQIMLSELQSFLYENVVSLSKGTQRPTSRIENLSLDFRVW